MNCIQEYERWCTDPAFDEKTKQELKSITDGKEIEDRFYKELSFGTGGLRGIIGAGTNRMNVYTVGKATQGLCNYIKEREGASVVIAYDSRKMSKEFALDSALILTANGIKVYLFEGLRPTPELSFAVRELNATAGIVITASHNPPQYNGYKVYWSDGGQIVPPHDGHILEEIRKISDYKEIKRFTQEEAFSSGLLTVIGEELDSRYIEAVKRAIRREGCADRRSLRIVYTPLNGTGYVPVTRILKELGFSNVFVVEEQAQPNGDFPTLKTPNPENASAFTLALSLAKKVCADIVLATDPDADRLGVYAKNGQGEYLPLTGNMSGLLIAEHELNERKERGLLQGGVLFTTVVSSPMARKIAQNYGVKLKEVLTGFKYIGEQMNLLEGSGEQFVFGFEESYGCLLGDYARDKDAVVASAKLAEIAFSCYERGLTLHDAMEELYQKYGYFLEGARSFTFKGADGERKMCAIMDGLRGAQPPEIGEKKVCAVRDYKSGIRRTSKTEEALTLPQSNVLYFELENGWCCARPSGTEPKIKFYFGANADSREEALSGLKKIEADILRLTAI